MMETKLWIALCALLLISLGSTEHDDGHAAASSGSESAHGGEANPEAPPAESVPGPSLDPADHPTTAPSLNDSNPISRGSSSVSNGTTTEEESISVTPVPKKANDTIVSPSEAANNETANNGNLRNQSTSQPPILPSGSHIPTSHTPTHPTAPTTATATTINTTTTTTTGPTHATHTTTADTPTTMPPTKTSHPAVLPDSIAPSNGSTSVPAPESPNPQTTTATTTTTTSTTTTTTTAAHSSQKPPHSELSTLSSTQNATGGYPKTSSKVHLSTTTTSPSTSAQTKPHADNPSQLNVEGDPTMVHDSPTLDPLLAGLVSAFIITAVIITLLLFLKLRRRDNRPEFRRLQDLPMDDMMEDTPLSMYSY